MVAPVHCPHAVCRADSDDLFVSARFKVWRAARFVRALRMQVWFALPTIGASAAISERRQTMLMSKCRNAAAAVGFAALIVSGCSLLQSSAEVTPVDQQFMLTAASVGTAEVDMAELAQHQAGDPAVRAYGRRLAQEHAAINEALVQLAERKHVKLIQAMDPADRTLYEELTHLSGRLFDREYLRAQINIHRMGNALYESEAQAGEDADVKTFAAKDAPAGAAHLHLAQSLLVNEGP
jgi:putative membrane protein